MTAFRVGIHSKNLYKANFSGRIRFDTLHSRN